MSTTETTSPIDQTEDTLTEREPISSAMPAGARACGRCGVPVAPADDRGGIVGEPGRRDLAQFPDGSLVQTGPGTPPVMFSTCPSCADRADLAAHILRAHPAVAARLGADHARAQLVAALDALAMVGASIPADDMAHDAALTHFVLEGLAPLGSAAEWTSAYLAREVTADQCAAVPFAAATPELRAAARKRVGEVLAYRVATTAPAVRLASPDRRPCMFCGIAAVEVPAHHVVVLGGQDAARDAVWSPRTATLHSLGRPSGGGASRERIDGHLCRPCARAAEHVGALGVAALARALTEHLRGTGQEEAARAVAHAAREETLTGLSGHATIGGRANSTPWAHVRLGEGLAPFEDSRPDGKPATRGRGRAQARDRARRTAAARGGAR